MTADHCKREELAELLKAVRKLEAEIATEEEAGSWPPTAFYTEYYATTGFLLGGFAAMASLLANVIFAPIAGKNPLELIRIFLTFPLGENALKLASQQVHVFAIGDGVVLAIGCCLYLATGMLLGVPFFVVLVRLTEGRSMAQRLAVAAVLSQILWVVNFYGILSWLQPLLIGGNWITNTTILPAWVAALTHLVFGLTLGLLYPWGKFQPYQQPTAASAQS